MAVINSKDINKVAWVEYDMDWTHDIIGEQRIKDLSEILVLETKQMMVPFIRTGNREGTTSFKEERMQFWMK